MLKVLYLLIRLNPDIFFFVSVQPVCAYVCELVCRWCHKGVRTPGKKKMNIEFVWKSSYFLKNVFTKYIFKNNIVFYIIKNCLYTSSHRQLQNVACPHSKVMFNGNGVEHRSSKHFLCTVVKQQLVFRSVSLSILAKQRKQNSSWGYKVLL